MPTPIVINETTDFGNSLSSAYVLNLGSSLTPYVIYGKVGGDGDAVDHIKVTAATSHGWSAVAGTIGTTGTNVNTGSPRVDLSTALLYSTSGQQMFTQTGSISGDRNQASTVIQASDLQGYFNDVWIESATGQEESYTLYIGDYSFWLYNYTGYLPTFTAIYSGAYRYSLTGTSGNDAISSIPQKSFIDGAAGLDSAKFSATRSSFAVTKAASGYTVTDIVGTNGTHMLTNVERLIFSDGSLGLDLGITQSSGQAAALLGSVLGKTLMHTKPDLIGAVIGLFDQGYTMQQLSGAIMRLPIWDALTVHAKASDADIASYLLTKVNGSAPDPATLSAAVAAIGNETGATQGSYLASLATSSANQIQIDLVGLQQTGLIYL